ncbi:methyl-accepting chemotaxis protein [Arcobacter caeni]|uniref:Chemotaxis protein n=1 Tax=Arcobacter caeni TaxID=1912877 RepID=A0A363CXG7_9BACT|nr:methyl-accepting chemotaxis protein [Arcobacter caeni]PUE63741.1 chemotaxis protein [Arcobacter caeni]
MFSRINTKKKLLVFPILFIVIVIVVSFFYLHFNKLANTRNSISEQTQNLSDAVLKTRFAAYKFLMSPTENEKGNIEKLFVKLQEDVITLQKRLYIPENIKLLDNVNQNLKDYLENFNIYSLQKEDSIKLKELMTHMVKLGEDTEVKLFQVKDSVSKLRDDAYSTFNQILIILMICSIIIFIAISIFFSNLIVTSINDFKLGLSSFFKYLNKEANEVIFLNDTALDEFGDMSKMVNENIRQVEKVINEDNALIEDAKLVMQRVNNGWYSQFIEKSTHNTSLEEFKNNVNEMIKSTRDRFIEVDEVLEQYTKHNYIPTLKLKPNDEKAGVFERLVDGINNLQQSITNMLIENKSNGLTLGESSNILLNNVNKLNGSSNSAATSLEETAAALEEVTSNIRQTTDNIAKMANYSNNVTSSVQEGEKLAKQTNISMDEINEQVQSINEAISIIDQIAFQTNILSLNAAVEAATAGEAGKGFAVVAQEVRNLASRSAEAAKEIKNLVENATSKANHGKTIAGNMIEGYEKLNENISLTIGLIKDVEGASKEQLLGIEQINDAVNALDQQTQQNAMIASQTHDVAIVTDKIAKLIVTNSDANEFNGKDDVKGKSIKK